MRVILAPPGNRILHLVVGLAALTACTDRIPTAPPPPRVTSTLTSELPSAGARGLTAMTRNVRFGGDLAALAFGPAPTPVRMATFYAEIQSANFPERAGAFARDIAATAPALVGLQEIATLRLQDPSDAISGGTDPATVVVLDFLDILLDSLEALGQSYYIAAAHQNADFELPMLASADPLHYVDLRYTDRDVILARSDVATSDAAGGLYAARISVTITWGDPLVSLRVRNYRGWVSTVATVGGVAYRFFNTHLESATSALSISEAQGAELVTLLASDSLPVVLVCDCNSAADGSSSRTYGWLVQAESQGGGGFLDTWTEANPRDPGYTASITSASGPSNADKRRDFVLVRRSFRAAPAAGILGGVHAILVGEEEGDRTASGLWPSDHAGVVATLRMPKALGIN